MKRRELMLGGLSALLCAGARDAAAAGAGEHCDVLVIGSGLAGLSAAVSASEAGAKSVVVLERERFVGGHSALANGYFAAERRSGRTDEEYRLAVQQMIEDMNQTGKGRGDPELVRTLAEESGDAVEWLSGMGVVWMERTYEALGGLRPRCYLSGFVRAGYDYVNAINRRARELGVAIRFSSSVQRVLRDSRGGFDVQYVKGDEPRSLHARSVVIASGGFGDNPQMRRRYDPRLGPEFTSTANPYGESHNTALGDGIWIGESLGAATVDMDQILTIPYSGGRLTNYVGADIYVNARGERFVNEASPMEEISKALWSLPERSFWVITDSQSAKGATRDVKLIKGIVKTADTIEEAAKGMGIKPAVLEATMKRYNEAASRGSDPDFGRTTFTQRIEKPPFYYGKERPFVHFCNGGLRINARGELLDAQGSVISGVFAAGEVTGGVHGHGRLGGASLPDCVVFGRRAGRSAWEYAKTAR
jgi:flavocytochrome c